MARDQKTDQKRPDPAVLPADAPIATAPAETQFVQTGAIPPVDTKTSTPAPTASDRAYGKGMQALEAMLAKGQPKAKDVASLIDANRGEHDQMLALVQQKLGDSFASSVRADLSSLRASIPNKEVVAGDPGDPNADYLDISAAQGGAKWKADGGKFTGTVDKKGLDTTVKAGSHDSIHAQVKPDKSGTVDWNHDGKTEAELAGHYKDSKNYDASLSRTQDVAGASVTEGVKHSVADGKTSDTAYADVKKGDTTAHADVGLVDGKPAEHLSASTKTKTDTITGSLGHDAKGTNAEIKDTHDFGNGKTGSLDVSDKAGTLAETGTFKTKTDELSETVSHDKQGTSAEVKDTHDFGNGKTGSLDVKRDAAGALSETGTLKTKTDDFSETVSHDKKGTNAEIKDTHDFGKGTTGSFDLKDTAGAWSETGTLTHKGAHDTETATVAHDKKGTTGSLTGAYDNGNTKLDGSVARTADAWKLHAGATEKINPALSVTGKVDETLPDKGKNQTDFSLSEKYAPSGGKVIQGLEVDGGKGAHDYMKATGSVDAQLAPNLYGSAWGSYSYEAGKQDTAQIGGSLTVTKDEKEALTLAGVVDQHGRFETRLQLDVFKDRVNSISSLDQQKKDAMVSLFISYSQQVGGNRMLDDRFGAPQMSTPNNASQVMAGIRIRF